MSGVRDKVRKIIEKIGAKEAPIQVEDVAKLFSIKILPYDDFPESISGMIVQESTGVLIGVNSKHAKVRQRFTVAHELGHFLSGHDDLKIVDDLYDKDTVKEREANEFAAELLMPYDILKTDVQKGGMDIPALSKKYFVSEQAMSIRLLKSGLIDQF